MQYNGQNQIVNVITQPQLQFNYLIIVTQYNTDEPVQCQPVSEFHMICFAH